MKGNNNPQVTASSQNLLYEICELCHVVKEKLGTFLLDETSVMSLVQQNKPELLTKAINSFVEATIDHMLKASSFLVSLKSPKGTTKHQFPLGRLGNKDAIAQTFKDAKGNYIICPHDFVANMTSMRSNVGTIIDKIRVLVYLVIWSCLSQDCYYSITLALLITDKRIKHHLNSFQFDQGEITKDCIWHWLQCLTMCITCTGSLSFQKLYTVTTHACLVFALPAAILDSCHIFTKIGVNPAGPIFNINPCNPEKLETSILKENPLLLMTHTFTLWCSRRLKEEIGIVKTTDHLQAIAESLKSSGKNSENASTITFFTKNFSSIHAKENFSMCMVSEEPTPKPEMSKRGNLPLNAKGPTLRTYAFPKEKVLRKPTGLQVQGPRGRGRGTKALWGGDNAMSVGCNEQGLPVGGGCPHRTPPRKKSPQKSPQTSPQKSPRHESSTETSLSSNNIQEMQSKKRKTPMKTTKTAAALVSLCGTSNLKLYQVGKMDLVDTDKEEDIESSTWNKKKLSITNANSPSTKHISSKKGANGTGISSPQRLMQDYFSVETRKKVGENKKQTMDGTTVVGASGEGSQSLGMTSSTKAKASLGGKPPLNKKSSTLNKKQLSVTKANSPSTKHVSSKKGVNGTGI